MGVDLYIFGNHRIDFTSRPFEEVAEVIIEKLNAFKPSNNEYFRLSYYHYGHYNKRWLKKRLAKDKKWTWAERDPYNEDHDTDEDPNSFNYRNRSERYIECKGACGFRIIFCQHHMQIDGPDGYRYWTWIGVDYNVDEDILILERNEWRKYFYEIVHLFGGNRVIYLPDNRIPTSRFCGGFVPFEALEANMLQDFGPPVLHFEDFKESPETAYMIDDFKTIDWHLHYPLEKFLPEPTIESDTNIDTTPFQSVFNLWAYCEESFYNAKLFQEKWDNYRPFEEEWTGYRQSGGVATFFHLMCYKGLLIKHFGVSGGTAQVEIVRDPYAPFNFVDIVADLEKKEGYSKIPKIKLIVILFTRKGRHTFNIKMTSAIYDLFWSGNGTGYRGIESYPITNSYEFLVNNKENALDLIKEAVYSIKYPLPIKIFEEITGNKRELLWETVEKG